MTNLIEKLGIEPDTMKLVRITPALASEILANNAELQRPIKPMHVNNLAQEMLEGRFVAFNGQTILLGTDGKLYDGQHRLSAIVKSDTTVDMYVYASSDPEAAYLTIDNHAKRGASDYLLGIPHRSDVAALAKIMYAVEFGTLGYAATMDGRLRFSNDSKCKSRFSIDAPREGTVLYAQGHESEMVDAVVVGKRIKASLNNIGQTRGYSAFVAIVRYCGKSSMLKDFVEELSTDTPTSSVPNILRNLFFKAYTAGGKRTSLNAKWTTERLLVAYETYKSGRNIKKLPEPTKTVEMYWRIIDEKRAVRRMS